MISLLYTLTSMIQETTAASSTSSRTGVVYMQIQISAGQGIGHIDSHVCL